MAKVKVGNIVHLNHDNEVLFTVVEDIGSSFDGNGFIGDGFTGMFRIVRFDKQRNNAPIELEVHEDSLVIIDGSSSAL